MTTLAVLVFVLVLNTASSTERLDLIRTALAVGAGTGAVMTLVLAWRRQWATEHDAAERRLTELYVKAVEQLGSDKAAVRHGAMYALERVAQDNPDHRQTVVNVICAYLRAPYTPPSEKTGIRKPGAIGGSLRATPARRVAAAAAAARRAAATPSVAVIRDDDRRQEREVRLTAQRILARHLHPGDTPRRPVRSFWADIDLDLTGAYLIDFDLVGCRARTTRFNGATFTGDASFRDTTFTGDALFRDTTFTGDASFSDATFTGDVSFSDAAFTRSAWFNGASFTRDAWFLGATFIADALFSDATFTGDALFFDATFTTTAWCNGATFTRDALFNGATFTGDVWFSDMTFTGDASFRDTTFTGDASFRDTTFTGTARFSDAQFAVPPIMSGASVRDSDQNQFTDMDWPAGWTTCKVSVDGGAEQLQLVPVPIVLAAD
ncbi:pentapeptide repeat-containing protein [Lentzea nigeriaca]|uniref:pentapeptide repeat-containing protein n=1 Tax=Lentzea nigeriaca TaxID=1128665 RepID=UPI001957A5E2|nr:pentapeptide repeat-containing protein [Lentzea nigeriaca]MBM7857850.1 hypothetical protein [Lentzea nigeriaca]